jgi:helix-turn-helix, Psq domain
MTRRINVKAIAQERKIQEAIDGVKSRLYTSYKQAAKALQISKTTLYERVKGRKIRTKAHERRQILSEDEEKELARWIRRLTN